MKAIILAGGSGTRLWPLSRSRYPKQFLKLKDMNQSLFQMTIDRCLSFCSLQDIYVVTVDEYAFIVQLQIEEMGHYRQSVHTLLEPAAKNTLPAIYFAVQEIQETCGDQTVLVLPSDHWVMDTGDFYQQVAAAAEDDRKHIFTFGIAPNAPETGFGYIMPGKPLNVGCRVMEFKEKPDYETAVRYVHEGYLWNSGMFMFNTELFSQEVKKHSPEVFEAFRAGSLEEKYAGSPSVSIDYGILEKTEHAAVIPINMSWDDLGSFMAFYETYKKNMDECQNICFQDNSIMIDSSNNIAYTDDGKLCAMIGVNDLVVIDQGDALLICDNKKTQEVKDVVNLLKSSGDARADLHLTEYRPWGSFTVLENGDLYKIKRLTVLSGKQLSYQMHYHRSEHWIVVSGTATVTCNGEDQMVHSGENIFVPAGTKHRLRNDGKLILEVIEVQSGQYLGEDDIVRYDDDYGRS